MDPVQGSASCVAPTASAQVRLRPLGSTAARILDGVLAERQRVNREVTLLRGAVQRGAEPTDSGPLPELGGMPGVSVAGVARDLDGWAQIEYIDVRELPPNGAAAPARPLAVPYFAWANRGAGGMRARVPTSGWREEGSVATLSVEQVTKEFRYRQRRARAWLSSR